MVALFHELGKKPGDGMKDTQNESLSPAKTLMLKKHNNKPVLIVMMNDEYRNNPFDDDDDDDASNDSESGFRDSSSNSSSSSNSDGSKFKKRTESARSVSYFRVVSLAIRKTTTR